MSRYFLIRSADNAEAHYTDGDLPLTIGSRREAHIPVPGGEEVEAYIGESQGHLFLQPAATASPSVFHNDEIVTKSVWIKSGDVIRIGTSVILYHVSGDRIVITVSEEQPAEAPALVPPEAPRKHRILPRTDSREHETRPWWRRKRTWAVAAGFFFLFLGALFVLFAKPVEVTVTPEPDASELHGFPPALRAGNRYLALRNSYVYTAEKKGYRKLVKELKLSDRGNGNRFFFTLEKLPGTITILSEPSADVTIYVDDEKVGVSPLPEVAIAAGEHVMRLEKALYKPLEQMISVEGLGTRQTFTFSLEPDWADIHLTSTPAEAVVSANDTVLGATPCTVQLPSGSHTLTFSKDGFSPSELALEVAAGKPVTSHIELQPAPALLNITSVPVSTMVMLDGTFRGHTPLTVELKPEQQHRLVVTAPGYATIEQHLVLSPEEKKELALRLSPEFGTVFLSVEPAGAEVFIDGKQQKVTTGRLELPTREQMIEVRAKGYETEKRAIVPKKGYSQHVAVRLQSASAAAASAPTVKVSPLGQELVLVRPSPFVMGAPRQEPGRRANEGEHDVVLNKPFYLSRGPVTNREFRRFRKDHDSGAVGGHSLNGDDQPVVLVGWEDAVEFLNWLSRQEGLTPFYQKSGDTFAPVSRDANGYRLPTEAEWAYAARVAGRQKSSRYPWDGSFPPRQVTGNYADESARSLLPTIITGYHDGFPVTSPVGKFPPNPAGFYDMGANVAEWCHDYYTAYTGPAATEANPLGPASGTHRVIRGASWRDSSITELRLSYRGYHRKGQDSVGFRVARYP